MSIRPTSLAVAVGGRASSLQQLLQSTDRSFYHGYSYGVDDDEDLPSLALFTVGDHCFSGLNKCYFKSSLLLLPINRLVLLEEN